MRIFLDTTQTVMFAAGTGIQRVVTRLSSCGVFFSPVAWVGQRYVMVPAHIKTRGYKVRRFLGASIKKVLLLYTNRAKHDAHIARRGKRGGFDLFHVCRQIGYFFLSIPYVFARSAIIQKGDVVIFGEITTAGSVLPRIDYIKEKGGYIVALVHDMFMFTHAQYFTARDVSLLQSYMRMLLKKADAVVAISQYTKHAVEDFLKKEGLPIPPMAVSYNGVDPLHERGHIRSEMFQIEHSNMPIVLVVGTLEPRKNHACVIDAFDRMLSEGERVQLVFVGGKGWIHDDVLRRIHNHPMYGTSFFVFHNAGDAELAYLYRSASVLIAASFAEGFDLPPVEARTYGCPVVASDIPIHQEILGTSASFFLPDNAQSLVQAIRGVLRSGRRDVVCWRSSEEQALEIKRFIESCCE